MMKTRIIALVLSAVPAFAAAGELDLLQAYRLATGYDAAFRAAQAALDASKESRPQALAQMLPAVSVSGTTSKNRTLLDTHNYLGTPVSSDYDFNNHGYRVSVSQPIFHYRNNIQYSQAKTQEQFGEARFAAAQFDLYVRVSQAYFDFLLAQDNQDLILAQKQAYQQQLDQAKKMYAGGVGTVTDAHEAQARLDIVISQEAQIRNQVEIKRRQLQEITGQLPDKLAGLNDSIPLSNPVPDSLVHWQQMAFEKNSEILAKQARRDYAQQEVRKSKADHLPTVEAYASWAYDKSPAYSEIDNRKRSAVIGMQVSIPIYQGGAVVSRSRQSEAEYRQAQEELDQMQRKIATQVNEDYLAVQKGVIEVKAMRQAVFSSESALHSTRMGLAAGTRTMLDVLNAQQQLFQSKRDLSRAKYEYVVGLLKLKMDAGVLQENDILQVNGWLQK